jgi:AraC-like DNA-binding protein
MTRSEFTILHTKIPGVTAVAAASRRSFTRHTHDEFGVGVIRQGAQKSLSGRGMVEAGAGDMITVNPNEVHDGMPIGDHGRSWSMLYFSQGLVADIAADVLEQARHVELTAPVLTNAREARRFSLLFAAVTSVADGFRSEMLLTDFMARLLCERRVLPSAPPAVARAIAMIDDDPGRQHSLASLARECGLSRFQLLRAFEKVTGLTAHAYLVQRRTDMARRLIAEGTLLAQAATASGFADQSHMTRIFVAKYGISPGRYAALAN